MVMKRLDYSRDDADMQCRVEQSSTVVAAMRSEAGVVEGGGKAKADRFVLTVLINKAWRVGGRVHSAQVHINQHQFVVDPTTSTLSDL